MRELLSSRRSFLPAVLGIALLATVFFPLQGDELTGPSPKDRRIALIVHSRLKDLHLTKHPLDDEISGRALKSLMKRLDPLKLYFLQPDIDEFNTKKNELDDMVIKGDVAFIYTVYERLLQRINERVMMANEWIGEHVGVSLFARRDADRPFEIMYVAARPGIWQGYQSGLRRTRGK